MSYLNSSVFQFLSFFRVFYEYEIKMKTVSKLLRVLILNILWAMASYAAPLLETKDIWSQNIFAPVIKAACSSDGQCWEWLPILETYNGNVILKENSDISRYTHAQCTYFPSDGSVFYSCILWSNVW